VFSGIDVNERFIALTGIVSTQVSVDFAGPKNWPGMCTTGNRQSPIDIITEDAVRTDLGALKFNRYDFAFASTLINTGHSGEQIDRIANPLH